MAPTHLMGWTLSPKLKTTNLHRKVSALAHRGIKCTSVAWHIGYSMNTVDEVIRNVCKDILVNGKASHTYIHFKD